MPDSAAAEAAAPTQFMVYRHRDGGWNYLRSDHVDSVHVASAAETDAILKIEPYQDRGQTLPTELGDAFRAAKERAVAAAPTQFMVYRRPNGWWYYGTGLHADPTDYHHSHLAGAAETEAIHALDAYAKRGEPPPLLLVEAFRAAAERAWHALPATTDAKPRAVVFRRGNGIWGFVLYPTVAAENYCCGHQATDAEIACIDALQSFHLQGHPAPDAMVKEFRVAADAAWAALQAPETPAPPAATGEQPRPDAVEPVAHAVRAARLDHDLTRLAHALIDASNEHRHVLAVLQARDAVAAAFESCLIAADAKTAP